MNKNLTKNIKETLDSSIVAYHGSHKNFDSFNQKINWFSTDREYALAYADASQNGVLYTVELQLDKVFDCGKTDGRVYEILPIIKPYKFSQRFLEIMSSIGITEEQARNLVKNIAEGRAEEYNIKIFSIINHKDFADIAISKGYDAIRTVEFGNECYGVFSNNNIKTIEKQNSEDIDLDEQLLENDEDYHTGEANGKDIFADRTGVSFYDSVRKDKEEAQRKNLKAEVVMMSPNEYYEECSKYAYGHYVSVDSLKQQRRYDKKVLDDLKDTVENHNRKLFMPYINRAEGGQEGLHRMMYVGDRFGWDEKFPVLCIDWIDEKKHQEDVKKEEERKIKNKLYTAIQKASVYHYNDINEFKEQMSYEIDRAFYEPTEFELNVNDEDISISVNNVSVDIPKEDLDVKSFDIEDDDIDLDLDDLSIDDLELL